MTKEQAEIERIQAEKEKLLAEKRTIENDAKHYWHKPVITGITLAITGLGILLFLFNTSYEQLQQASALEIAVREYENSKTKDSILVKKQEIKLQEQKLSAQEVQIDSALQALSILEKENADGERELQRGQIELRKAQEAFAAADVHSKKARQAKEVANVQEKRCQVEYERLTLVNDSLTKELNKLKR